VQKRDLSFGTPDEFQKRLNDDIVSTTKSQQKDRLSVLRKVKTQVQYQQKEGPGAELTEESIAKLLLKMSQNSKDTEKIMTTNGREDLAEKERYIMQVVGEYLPELPTIREKLVQAVAESGAQSQRDAKKIFAVLEKAQLSKAEVTIAKSLLKDVFETKP